MTFGLRFCVDRKRQPPEDIGKEKFILGNGRYKAQGRAWSSRSRNMPLWERRRGGQGKRRGEVRRKGRGRLCWGLTATASAIKGFADHYHHFHSVYSHALQWTVSYLLQFFFMSHNKFSWFSLYRTYTIFKFITIHKFLIIINGVFYFLSMHMF